MVTTVMAKNQTKSTVKSDKHQSEILIGVSLIIVGVIILYIALSQPKVISKSESSVSVSVASTVDETASSSKITSSSSKIEKDENVIVNINTCSPEELMQIPGIGESKANAIVAYRNVIGSYSSTEEVKNISGFSDKFYESIKDNITV